MKKIAWLGISFWIIAAAVEAHTLEQDLKVEIGVFDAAKVHMAYTLDPQMYVFQSAVEAQGLFGKVYPFAATYYGQGRFVDGKPVTADYHYRAKTRQHLRTKRLVFDNQGRLLYRVSAKDGKEKSVEVQTPSYGFDVSDLQTIFALIGRKLMLKNSCAMEQTVYDGKKHYNVILRDQGIQTLEDPALDFKGAAHRCAMMILPLAQDDDDMLWQATAERPIIFWVLKEPKTEMPYLLKVEIADTPLGQLKAYSTNLIIKD